MKFDIFDGNRIYEWEILSHNGNTCTCKCSCGVIKDVNTNNLANGLSKSCGHTRRHDLTDQQFGDWYVVKYLGRRDRKSFYLCRCSCGTEREIRSYDLTHSVTKSCGHEIKDKREKLKGNHFGEWEVLQVIDCKTALCKCSCGVEKEVSLNSLKNGTSKSCGHAYKDDLKAGDIIDDITLIKKDTNGCWICRCKCNSELRLRRYEILKYSHKCKGKHKIAFRDLKDKQFGEWSVLEYVGNSLWKCKCSCGAIKNINSYILTTGKSKHCTSEVHNNKFINIKEQRFGKLIAKDYTKPYWICECDCGNTVKVLSHNLRNGSTTSCGCSRVLLSEEQIIKEINKFKRKPFNFELAESLGVHESTIRRYIDKYNLHNKINKSFKSRYEYEIAEYIESKGIDIKISDRILISPQELDLYIPSHKIALEFNGNYWHSDVYKNETYHQNKTIDCAKQGIQLIHIFEYEWINDSEKILNLIDNILDINITRLFARNTKVKEIDDTAVKQFLTSNHLQGYAMSSVNIGCYIDDELVGVMTFGTPRFNKEYEYELIRYCCKDHIKILGGASKLFTYFIKKYKPKSIITYSDISKFTGNIYTKLGFKVQENAITKPNYVWYNHSNNQVLSRYKTQKAELIRLGLDKYGSTEDEIMYNLGYYKIYNSGNIRLEWKDEIYS